MNPASLELQIVTGPADSLKDALNELQQKFSYVSEVMLVTITTHDLKVAGPLFGFILDVPNLLWGITADGDFFVPLGTAHRGPIEQQFDQIIGAFEAGSVGAFMPMLRQAYDAGPGASLGKGGDKTKIKHNQTVQVLKRWKRSYEDTEDGDQ